MTTFLRIFSCFGQAEIPNAKSLESQLDQLNLESPTSTFDRFRAKRCINYLGLRFLKPHFASAKLLIVVVRIDALRFVVLQSLFIRSLIAADFGVQTNQDNPLDCYLVVYFTKLAIMGIGIAKRFDFRLMVKAICFS